MHQNRKRCSRMALLQSLGAGTLVALLAPGALAQVKVQAIPDSVLRPYSVPHAAAAPVVAAPLPATPSTAPAADTAVARLQLARGRRAGRSVTNEHRRLVQTTESHRRIAVGIDEELAELRRLSRPNSACCRWCAHAHASTTKARPAARSGCTRAAPSSSRRRRPPSTAPLHSSGSLGAVEGDPTCRSAINVFIVTGGASGLGGATSRMLATQGGKVIIADVQADRGEALARELGANARYVKCDVSSEADGRAAVDAALASRNRCAASSTAPALPSAKRSSARKDRMRSRRSRGSSTST